MSVEAIVAVVVIVFMACLLTAIVVSIRTETTVGKRCCRDTGVHDWATYCRRCGEVSFHHVEEKQ